VNRQGTTYDAALRAFRAVTEDLAPGATARARMLASAERRVGRGGAVRAAFVLAAAIVPLVALVSGAAAWTLVGLGHWRAETPRAIDSEATLRSSDVTERHPADRPTRVIPAVAPVAHSLSSAEGDGELAAYARAHRAHFIEDAPTHALAAWDAYLSSYPAGALAPEASYNRAVCLARLGRFVEASAAFRPFARGRFRGYRREEAARFLDWLADRRSVRPSPGPASERTSATGAPEPSGSHRETGPRQSGAGHPE
jgi:hypothetical protein